MIHRLPDPYPGRCLNTRPDLNDDYGTRSKRCLEMDGHNSPCRFEPDQPQPATAARPFTSVKPKRWVVPDRSEESS